MSTSLSGGFIRSIDANRTIKDALTAAIGTSRPRWRVSVTDLVNPRQAYFRWKYPEIKPSPDRLQLMMAGTGFHDVFGRVVSTEEYLEQLLEFEGIVGKVDIYEDLPVEVKTTSSIPGDIYGKRTSYFEQLGMYCAMADKEQGRLVVYQRQSDDHNPDLRVYETHFLDLARVGQEMRSRRDMFQNALEQEDASELPRCEWFYRGCDYSGVCGCRSAAPGESIVSRDEVAITPGDHIAERLMSLLASAPAKTHELRLNDLVFPRKAAMRRAVPEEDSGDAEVEPEARLTDIQRHGFNQALYSALRAGSAGEFKAVPVRFGSISDKVQMYQEMPTILRTTKFRTMVERERLPGTFPHYFDRLAIECAVTNVRRGRLILYYEVIPGDKFMVYDVVFQKRDEILTEAEQRLGLLESGATPTELPACPEWMAKFCEFAAECGCGE